MMKTSLFLLLVTMTLVGIGCSSGPKKDQPEKKSAPAKASQGDDDFDNMGDETDNVSKGVEIPAGTLDQYYKKFSDARAVKNQHGAQEAAGEILARNPNDLKILNALALMAIDQGKFNLARMLLGKVLAKDPNNSAAQNNLGLIEMKSDNLRMALVKFKKSVELDNGNKSAHANLGSIYLQYRNFPSAAAELDAAYKGGDKSLETLSNLGMALSHMGQYDRATDIYEKALSKDASNVPVMFNYSVLLVEHLSRPKKALKFLNKIRFVAHEPAILEKVGSLAKRAEAAAKGSTERESSD